MTENDLFEFQDLISKLVDSRLTVDEATTLANLLKQNLTLRKRYREIMQLHADLAWLSGTQEKISVLETNEIRSSPTSTLRIRNHKAFATVVTAASLIFLVWLIGAFDRSEPVNKQEFALEPSAAELTEIVFCVSEVDLSPATGTTKHQPTRTHLTEQESGKGDRILQSFRSRDGRTIIDYADGLLATMPSGRRGGPGRKINYLSMKVSGLYYLGKRDEAIELALSLHKESGTFKEQVLCSKAEFFVIERADDPSRNLKVAIQLAEQAIANKEPGQQWPAEGTLAFVLQAVELEFDNTPGEHLVDEDYFLAKLDEYQELRTSDPRVSGATQLHQQIVFGPEPSRIPNRPN